MIRTLLIAAAVAAIAPAAFAQPAYSDSNDVIVQGQPRDAYIIRVDTYGKDEATIRREISDAANTACQRAPSTGNHTDIGVNALQGCITQANSDALVQLGRVLESRRQGYVEVAAF